ncbi:MAG: tetratricopeptide repeat protein [Victivallales bacterium]|nr:tetratricopeptide repeat protein [Victivallales bacterium]
MKQLILVLLWLGLNTAATADSREISRDEFPPEEENKVEDYSDIDIPQGKSDALAAFSEYMLAKTPEQRLEKLLKTIDADPLATVPLGCFIRELDGIHERRNFQNRLIDLSRRHPAALRLGIAAAYFLSQEKQQLKMLDLVNACLDTVDTDHPDPRELTAITDLISLAARGYIQTERYVEGDEFFRRYLDRKDMTGNLRFLAHALMFYNSAREKGRDESGFWWFSETSQERYKRIYGELEKDLQQTVEKADQDPADILPVLEICRKNEEYRFGADLAFQMLAGNPDEAKLLAFLAIYYDNCNMSEESFRIWRTIVARAPMQIRFSLELAKAAEKAGHDDIAMAAYRNYLRTNPNDPAVIGRLSILCLRHDQAHEVIAICEPLQNHPLTLCLCAGAYRRLKQYDRALELLQRCETEAVKMKIPKLLNNNFYRDMAFLYDQLGQVNKAETILKAQLAQNPKDPIAANALGYIWADHNLHLPEAQKLIAEAGREIPDSPAITDSMAWVLYRQGKFQEAAVAIEQAMKQSGRIPDAILAAHAGDIYFSLKQPEKARHYWQLALQIYDPDGEIDRAALKAKIAALTRPGTAAAAPAATPDRKGKADL